MNRGKRPKIKITITDRRGKMGCHRGHHVGEVFDYDEDRGKICPMAMHCAFPYRDSLRDVLSFVARMQMLFWFLRLKWKNRRRGYE